MGFDISFNKKVDGDKSIKVNAGSNNGKVTLGYDDPVFSESDLNVSVDKDDISAIIGAFREAGEQRRISNEQKRKDKLALKEAKIKSKGLKSSND